MDRKELKKQVYGVLEDYGFFQQAKHGSWEKEYRNRFFEDFLIIAERYKSKHEQN